MGVDKLTNPLLATLAVALLGGDTDYVDPEDIAVQADHLAPGRFGWRKYPERIDLDAVRVALRDAKKDKNHSLIIGSNVDGWMLTPTGLSWVLSLNLASLPEGLEGKQRKESIIANRETERSRLRQTNAYELFTAGQSDSMTLQTFYQFARINEYFGTRARQRRIAIVDNAVTGDETLADLWSLLKTRFATEEL